MFPLNLYARVRFSLCSLHTRPRVQRAPGLPCALCFFLGRHDLAKLGRIASRECGIASSTVFEIELQTLPVIASAAKQSISPLAETWVASLRSQ